MHVTIGIPRALLYHEYGQFWTDYFKNLNISYIVSPETNKSILDRGTELAIDESCLPLKIFLGHIDSIISKCDQLFIPRIDEYRHNFFMCAKLAGLSDVTRHTFCLPDNHIITPNIENPSWLQKITALRTTTKACNRSFRSGYCAMHTARCAARQVQAYLPSTIPGQIAVIGHSYLLQDAFFCRDIFTILRERHKAWLTPADVPNKILFEHSRHFQPDIYWQLSAKIAGATRYFSQLPQICGIVMVSSFNCGPDSLCNEYLEHTVLRNCDKPYIILTLDEHTGTAGLATRLDAFMDLLEWRSRK